MTNPYSAAYFNRAKQILDHRAPVQVTMQVFQKGHSVLAGMDDALRLFRNLDLDIRALSDGDSIEPWETVMTITGNLAEFVHLESIYLGYLARGTRVATNMRRVVEAANGKQVIFMGDRFDRPENQRADGYAALLAGASEVCTEAMTWEVSGKKAVGTMPHALIAAFGGDVVKASQAFRDEFPEVPLTALVDFNNDCLVDSLRCVQEFGKDLYAVRLDTSENMVDVGLADGMMQVPQYFGDFKPTGVNPILVGAVRKILDTNGGEHVKIVVSGGFTPEKIADFEKNRVPVDVYGVGSSIIKNGPDFTADVVLPVGKAGRRLRPNDRLKKV